MTSKRVTVSLVITTFVVIFLYLFISLKGKTQQHYETASKGTSSNVFDYEYEIEETFMPENWTGLPISINNNLWMNYSIRVEANIQHMVDLLVHNFNQTESWAHDGPVIDILHKYSDVVGWNGVFDGVDRGRRYRLVENAESFHQLGELVAEHADRARYGIEITARVVLHKAPLHGVVWYFITHFPYLNDTDKLYKYIQEELCFMEGYENQYTLWISCAHGVGHGLLKATGDYNRALEICNQNPNGNFKYACATGIFMELHDYPPRSMHPCNLVSFPAACFQFKRPFYDAAAVYQRCMELDDYHRRGCIFGEGHHLSTDAFSAITLCDKYRPEIEVAYSKEWRDYLACLSGVWQIHHIYKLENFHELCDQFKGSSAYDLCVSKSVEEDFDEERWDWELLEVIETA